MAEPALGQRSNVVRAGAGAEHIGDQHRVVERADIDACAVHRQPVVFQIVADLEHRAVEEQRLQRGQRLVDGDLVVGAAAAQQILRAGTVADGNVGRLARPYGDREADRLGPHRVERGGLGAEGDDAGFARLCYPCLKLGQMADAGVALVVDLGAGDSLRPRAGKGCRRIELAVRDGRAGRRHSRAARRHSVSARGAPAPTSGPWTSLVSMTTAAGATSAASVPVASATRRVSVENSIVFRKAMSFWSVGLLQHEIVEPVGQRHVVLQPDQLARDARLVGIVDDRLPALFLLDLAGAGKQRVEIAELFEQLRGGLLARCRARPARCRRNRRSSPAGRSSSRAARPISR